MERGRRMTSIKANRHMLLKSCKVLFLLLPVLNIFSYGCISSGFRPKELSILPSAPLSNTDISSYLSIETLFESDQEIVLVVIWDRISKAEKHTLKWEIVNCKGNVIFSSVEKEVIIRPQSCRFITVPLKGDIENGLIPGELTVNFHIDEDLTASKRTTYTSKKIACKKARCAVILPFVETCDYLNLGVMIKSISYRTRLPMQYMVK